MASAPPVRVTSTPVQSHSPSTSGSPSTTGSLATAGSASGNGSAPSAKTTVPPAADQGEFSLVVATGAGKISTSVDAISVASGQPVDPPHETAAQWATAVWVEQSSYPSGWSDGTSYVYGHACHHHVCPFTNLKDAVVGDRVIITTASSTLTYRIGQIGLSAKSARSLPSWASDSTVPDRVVLVTCAFEQGDTSTQNIVVVARLQAVRAR